MKVNLPALTSKDFTDIELAAEIGCDWVAMSFVRAVSYTHLRAHETVLDLVCRLLLENKQKTKMKDTSVSQTPIE